MRLTKSWAKYIAHVAEQFGFQAKVNRTDETCNGIRIYTVTLVGYGEIATTVEYAEFRVKHAFVDMKDFKRMWDAIEEQGNNDVKRL